MEMARKKRDPRKVALAQAILDADVRISFSASVHLQIKKYRIITNEYIKVLLFLIKKTEFWKNKHIYP